MLIKCPILPPGINQTYKCGKGRFYKSKIAKDWQRQFALIVGTSAAEHEWEDLGQEFSITLIFDGKHDADASIKLVQDTIAEKLQFNDNRVKEIHIYKHTLEDEDKLLVLLEDYSHEDYSGKY